MGGYRTPETNEQALVEALHAALVAPDEGKAKSRVVAGVIVAQNGLDGRTVEPCRAAALARWEAERRSRGLLNLASFVVARCAKAWFR